MPRDRDRLADVGARRGHGRGGARRRRDASPRADPRDIAARPRGCASTCARDARLVARAPRGAWPRARRRRPPGPGPRPRAARECRRRPSRGTGAPRAIASTMRPRQSFGARRQDEEVGVVEHAPDRRAGGKRAGEDDAVAEPCASRRELSSSARCRPSPTSTSRRSSTRAAAGGDGVDQDVLRLVGLRHRADRDHGRRALRAGRRWARLGGEGARGQLHVGDADRVRRARDSGAAGSRGSRRRPRRVAQRRRSWRVADQRRNGRRG